MECSKFVGSSYAWHWKKDATLTKEFIQDGDTPDCNIIPKEITERIIDTILVRRDDFKVSSTGVG